MNKPRPNALPLKKAVRVSPPTAPGFFSFHSFRVKKNSKGDPSSTESSTRRRVASGDSEQSASASASSSWASAVVSPLAAQKVFTDNGRVPTFKTFGGDSAPASPCTGSDYRFVKESYLNHPSEFSRNQIETQHFAEDKERGSGCYTTGIPSEMHTGYYDKKATQKSISDTNDIPTKPPTGILRHQTLRSNSEPHGHGYYGGGTDLNGGPSHGGFSNVYGGNHTNHGILEDQGIDMSQSPGHESPSSTVSSNTVSVSGGSGVGSSVGSAGTGHSRHSAASFDSGRASSSLYQQGVRYSGLSSESSSTGSCRHSYHSSSSSLGSIPPEEICNFDVSSMIAQGLPDPEILNAWLTGVHFECYYQNFIQAGYDMQTIVKMTPEDLNAIGITKPNHRKRLKSEISQLIIPDGLPDYIPSTIEEWLRVLRMDEYTEKLKAQGYSNVRQVTNITWEDLEDIGILKLGHQKKFLLAIKRIEDILSGKRLHTCVGAQNPYHPALDCYAVPHRLLQNNASASQLPYSQHNPNHGSQGQGPSSLAARAYINSLQKGFASQQQQQQQHPIASFNNWRQNSMDKDHSSYHHEESLYETTDKPHLQLLTHQPQIHQEKPPPPVTNGLNQPEYHPEVIAIHVKSDRRPSTISDHCGEPIYGTSSFQAPSNQAPSRNGAQGKWLEDGETTPTNEADVRPAPSTSHFESSSGTSTLPRLMKNKAIGKPVGPDAKMNNMGNPKDPHSGSGLEVTYQNECSPAPSQWQQQHQMASMDGYKSLPKNMGRFQSTFGAHRNSNPGVGVIGRQPPPSPRRSSSTTQESRQETFSTFHPTSSTSGLVKKQVESLSWGNSNSNDDVDLPAPPPPEDLALMSGSGSSVCGNAVVPKPASKNTHSLNSTTSSTSLTASSSGNNTNANAASLSTTNLSDYHHQHHNNAYASNSSTNPAAYSSNNTSSRVHPPTAAASSRLRDPSPGSSDTDVSVTFATVGVRRNGSDASFKSSSSTESESLPFANDNAGTIKQQKPGNRAVQGAPLDSIYGATASSTNAGEQLEAGDVLSDIGNMLADLTDELDAILQQEMDSLNKR